MMYLLIRCRMLDVACIVTQRSRLLRNLIDRLITRIGIGIGIEIGIGIRNGLWIVLHWIGLARF
jgi:hypothetical protein